MRLNSILLLRVKDSLPETHSSLGRRMLLTELTSGDSEEDATPCEQPTLSVDKDPAEPTSNQTEQDTSKR